MNTIESAVSTGAKVSGLLTDQSVAKQLLFGNVLEENLFPYPAINDRDREVLGMIVESIDRFLEGKQADFARWDREARQPDEFVQSLRELGLFGLIIPEEFGGLGLSNAAYARVLAQTSSYDSSVSLTIGAHSSIGMKGLLLFGTAEQKARYLPKLATGEMIAAFCLTESGAGSDAAAIRTTARRNADGSFTLNGEKLWITNGGIADFYTVFARTDGPEGKVTAFIVEARLARRQPRRARRQDGHPRVLHDHGRLRRRARAGRERARRGRQGLQGRDGDPEQRPHRPGRRRRRRHEDAHPPLRGAGAGAQAVRPADRGVRAGAREDRADDGRVLRRRERGRGWWRTTSTAAARTTRSRRRSPRCSPARPCSARPTRALQIAGGNGYMRELPYEQYVRDARILPIFEGTNEILRLFIALSSLKDVGASLKELQSAVGSIFNDPIKGFGVLSGYAERRFARATGLGAAVKVSTPVAPALRPLVDIYESYARATARVAEGVLRKYGRGISEQQHSQRRIADLMIDLFVGLCVVSRADSIIRSDPASAPQVTDIAKVFTHQARRRMVRNVRGLSHNEDQSIEALAGAILEKGRYPWDVL